MRKFKHKQTGIIVIQKWWEKTSSYERHYNYVTKLEGALIDTTFKKEFIENTNDWEEIIEKEYEIVSFINKNNQIFEKTWQSPLYHHFYITNGYYLDEILTGKDDLNRIYDRNLRSYQHQVKLEEFKIYSVKRLSDGEIFTIGDKVNNDTLLQFELVNNEIHCNVGKDVGYNVLKLKSLLKTKQPLFKTEDNINIFEGDLYFSVFTSSFVLRKWKAFGTSIKVSHVKDFSTKEAAEEYIVLNKPCLSIASGGVFCSPFHTL